jgi:hypothetical protein
MNIVDSIVDCTTLRDFNCDVDLSAERTICVKKRWLESRVREEI